MAINKLFYPVFSVFYNRGGRCHLNRRETAALLHPSFSPKTHGSTEKMQPRQKALFLIINYPRASVRTSFSPATSPQQTYFTQMQPWAIGLMIGAIQTETGPQL